MKQYKETFQLDDSIIDTLHYDTFIKTLQTIDYKYKYMFDLSQSFHNYCDYLQSDIFIDDKSLFFQKKWHEKFRKILIKKI